MSHRSRSGSTAALLSVRSGPGKERTKEQGKGVTTDVRSYRLSGGYTFRNFAGQPQQILEEFGLPERAVISLGGGGQKLPEALVRAGAQVHAGQILAEVLGKQRRCIVSPVSGKVERVGATGDGARSIVIVSDGSPAWLPLEPVTKPWREQSREQLEDLLYAAGLDGLPTRLATAPIGAQDVKDVVLSAMSADVYNPSPAVMVDAGRERLKTAVRILQTLYAQARVHAAVGEKDGALLSVLRAALDELPVIWHRVPARFPLQMDAMLHQAVSDRPRSPGSPAVAAGTLALDIQKALAVHDAIVEAKPAIERIVALCGPGFTRNVHLRLRVGTPLSEIVRRFLGAGEFRLVENSLMLGRTLDASTQSISASTSALIAIPERDRGEFLSFARPGFRKDSHCRAFVANLLPFTKAVDTNLHGEARPCIACGFCEDVCPMRLMPHLLHRYVQRDFIDETLVRFGIDRCIECNLCSYVCTSKIDVASLLRKGKEKLAAEGLLPSTGKPEVGDGGEAAP